MNIQNNLDSVLDKFPKDKTELAKHKVNLTLADDLKKMFDVVDKRTDELDSWRKPTQEIINKIKNLKEDIRNTLSSTGNKLESLNTFIPKLESLRDKISTSAKELGINPKEIKGFDKINIRIKQIKSRPNDFKSDSKEARQISKE